MVRISELSDDLLLKILSFLPTKVAVSTSILSKQWQFLWMWLPKLEYNEYDFTGPKHSWSGTLRYEEFIDKNLPLHRAPVIESLLLKFFHSKLLQPEKIKRWVGIAVSRFVRELSISYFDGKPRVVLSLPSSLYTCNSLMTLKLEGKTIVVDVPRIVCLPSLKTLQLQRVIYSNEDSLPLLLSHCPVLEDLLIKRDRYDNLRTEEETMYPVGIVFSQLEHLKLCIRSESWSELLIWLLRNSPKLRVLNLCVDRYEPYKEYQPVNWKNTESSVPECLLRSLETFEFKYYRETQEERDFLSFFFKHARCLKSSSIIHRETQLGV